MASSERGSPKISYRLAPHEWRAFFLSLLAMPLGAVALESAKRIVAWATNGKEFVLLEALSLALFGLAVPAAVYQWGVRRPSPSFFADWRVWFFALLSLSGMGELVVTLKPRELRGALLATAGLGFYLIIIVWGTARYSKRQAALRQAAEKHGWKLSRKETADIGWEDFLLEEMTRRERVLHYVINSFCILLFLASFIGATLSDHWVFLAGFIVSFFGILSYLYGLIGRQFIKRRHVQYELDAARRMQMALLPTRDPEVPGFDISGMSLPAEEVGGDLYSYFGAPSGESTFGIALADVSGKAMKAAIATVLLSGVLRAETRRPGEPSEILSRLNAALLGGMDPYTFVAMQVVVLNPATGKVHYSNAGQVHPYLLRKGALSPITQNALPLGVSDAAEYATLEIMLEAGDVLFLLSDGITEAMNARREFFGYDRLETAILTLDPTEPSRALINDLIAHVDSFRGKAPPSDDRTIVVVSWRRPWTR